MSDSTSGGSADYVLLTRLADEFAARYRAGERPSLQEYIDRHPSLADDIRDLFPAMVEIEQVKEVRRAETDQVAPPRAPALEQLGDFRILREVGKGGMGIVYEAEQVSLGRHVALKVLPGNMGLDARAKRRFEREARSAARLHHTNIVPVFGVGEQDGLPYYVMQFIQGLGLDAVLEELKKLRAGGPRAGTLMGGEIRASRPPETTADGTRAGTDIGTRTVGGMSAVSMARSLLTGAFRPGFDQDATMPETLVVVREEIRDESERRPPIASDSFTASSSSVILPGQSRDGSRSKHGKRTYWQSVAAIGVQVAEALEYAHKQGILHRDIKPSNLLLDTQGTVWVADFGLAKADDQQNLTDTGDLLGTLRYMPPEAFEGKADARGDVYSLGLTLYEMLAFRAAFDEKDRNRLIRRVTEADPDPLGKVNRLVPHDLETIVHKAIDKDPARRYQSAGALAQDLQRFIDDEPIQARRVSEVERVWRWSRRHKAVAGLLATLATVLTVGCIVMTILWSRAERSASIANMKEKLAESLASKEAVARAEAQALATKEAKARGEAEAQQRLALEKAELLAREDYVNRVNRAYREVQDDNVALAEDLLHGCDPARRGWEWHFVERLCNSERRVVDLGDVSIIGLAYSPDGKWVVTGSGTQPVHPGSDDKPRLTIWDVESGRSRATLPAAKGLFYEVAVSPDGKKVAAGFAAGVVMVWDVATGRTDWTRSSPGLEAMSVAFSPDGRTLAAGYGVYSGGQVGQVRLWDVATGDEIRSFAGPVGGVNKLAFRPDGKRLAASGSGVVEVFDPATGSRLQQLKGHRKWVYCVAYSPDGKWLASGAWDGAVILRDAETGAEKLTIAAHEGFVLDLAFSPDGRSLATSSEDRSIRLWEIPGGKRLAKLHGHTDFINKVAFRPDGLEVCSGGMDGSLRFWDLRTCRQVVVEHGGWVDHLAVRRDGRRVLSESGLFASDHNVLKCWDPLTGELDSLAKDADFKSLSRDYIQGSSFQPLVGVTSPDGKYVVKGNAFWTSGAARSRDYSVSSILVRERSTGEILHTLTGHSADVVSIVFSPDSRRLATASYDRTVKIWDLQTGQNVFTILGHTAGVVSVAFSPDGHQIVTGGIDSTARVWNATPLPSELTAQHDDRYRRKIQMLDQLKLASDDEARAAILIEGGRWTLAAEALSRIAAKNRPTAYVQLLDVLVRIGDRPRLEAACEEYLERFGRTNDPLRNLEAEALCELARLAIEDPAKRRGISEVLKITDFRDRILVIGRFGGWSLVEPGLARIVEEHPDETAIRTTLAKAMRHNGKYDEAIAQFREVVRRKPDDDHALADLAGCLYERGRFSDALVVLKRLAALQESDIPSSDRVEWVRSIEVMIAMEAVFPRFLKGEYQPKNKEEREALIFLCLHAGEPRRAARLLAELHAADPKDSMVYLRLAALQAWLGLDGELAATLEKVRAFVRKGGSSADAERAVKSCSILPSGGQAERDEAADVARAYGSILSVGGMRPWVYMALGMAEYRRGRYEAAVEALDVVADSVGLWDPEQAATTSAFYKAMSLFRLGKTAEARQVALAAATRMTPLPRDERLPAVSWLYHEDMIMWLAYKEAKALIGFEQTPAGGPADGK